MEPKPLTSFIPKQVTVPGPVHRTRVGVLGVLSTIIFLGTLALAGGVFFYRDLLVDDIGEMNARLVRAKNAFEPELIKEFSAFHSRLEAAKTIIAGHQAISPLFDLLEERTLSTVRFSLLELSLPSRGAASLRLSGEARGFTAIALQSDIFGGETAFRNPVFSNFDLGERGEVRFSFTTDLDPSLLRYRNLIEAAGQTEGAALEEVLPENGGAPAPAGELEGPAEEEEIE